MICKPQGFCGASERKKHPWFQLWHIYSVIMLFLSGMSFLFNLHTNRNVTSHKSCEILSLPWKHDSWCMSKEIGQIQQNFFQGKLCIFQPIVFASITTALNRTLWIKWFLLIVIKEAQFIYLCINWGQRNYSIQDSLFESLFPLHEINCKICHFAMTIP